MSFRPARTRLRRVLPLAVAAAIGVAAGAGAYALTNQHSGSTAAPNVVVPAQPASSTSTGASMPGARRSRISSMERACSSCWSVALVGTQSVSRPSATWVSITGTMVCTPGMPEGEAG